MPFQQYAKYVGAQGKSINTLVTELRLDSDSATPKLTFKPVRYLTEQEWLIAKEKGDSPAAKSAVTQTASTTDNVKPKAIESVKAVAVAEVEEAEVAEPTKRPAKKNATPAPKKDFVDVLNDWSTDDA
jgi:hypothetical protein